MPLPSLVLVLVVVVGLLSPTLSWGHKPLLSVQEGGDGAIAIEAGFSDGSSAAGHKIIVREEGSSTVLSEHRVGQDGTLELKKPSVPYTVTLDAGEGHVVTVKGPPPDAVGKETQTAVPERAASRASEGLPSQPLPAEPMRQAPLMTTPSSLEVSPGFVMAFKMMITAQIVTATVLTVMLAVGVYFIGYAMGRNAARGGKRREV